MTLCPNCSQALEEGTRFCPSCGIKIGEGVAEQGSLLGTTLNGKYRVISELGTGAMGTVYLGEHLSLKKQVALKVLHTDLQIGQEALVRFQREGIAAGKFNHPGAIQIFDFDVEGKDTWYLAME
ncbi:MAG: serine/threonine protein kinase, partial [Planctomycetota bacterium]